MYNKGSYFFVAISFFEEFFEQYDNFGAKLFDETEDERRCTGE